ncbi:MAG: translational GTPase TypA, partial [bacterium]|nr:translational GTPase TypA [bacterium]
KIEKVFVSQGLKRVEVPSATAGDIACLTGIAKVEIGQTITDANHPEALPAIAIEEPTLAISIYANTAPFAGKEGKYVTARHLLERINKELETNVSMRLAISETGEYILSGRGELHLSVFIEALRREGFELQVGKPQVITKMVNGKECEPIEELTLDVASEYASSLIGEVNRRRGVLLGQYDNSDSSTKLLFEVPTRGLLGIRNQLLTLSRGTVVINTLFVRYEPKAGSIAKLRNGVLIAQQKGKATIYGLDNAQNRGATFIPPQTEVYEGMIVGLHSREDDIEINVCKEKQLTNMRAAAADMSTILTPHTDLSLEQCLDFLEDDELLEVTPLHLRLRKKMLNANERYRVRKSK